MSKKHTQNKYRWEDEEEDGEEYEPITNDAIIRPTLKNMYVLCCVLWFVRSAMIKSIRIQCNVFVEITTHFMKKTNDKHIGVSSRRPWKQQKSYNSYIRNTITTTMTEIFITAVVSLAPSPFRSWVHSCRCLCCFCRNISQDIQYLFVWRIVCTQTCVCTWYYNIFSLLLWFGRILEWNTCEHAKCIRSAMKRAREMKETHTQFIRLTVFRVFQRVWTHVCMCVSVLNTGISRV